MKQYTTYVCEKCQKESRNYDEIYQCEAKHLGLTVDQKRKRDDLIDIVKMTSSTLTRCNNTHTRHDYDKAVETLIAFEKECGIAQ